MRGRARPRRAALDVVIVDGQGRPASAGDLAVWLRGVAPSRARGVITIALAPDRQVRELNRRFARHDAATDVLSFGAVNESGRNRLTRWSGRLRMNGDRLLGEIVIARGIARRQARAAGHPYHTELKVLALHGLLHLLGYDHEDDGGVMARVERRLQRKGGLQTGLIARAREGVR